MPHLPSRARATATSTIALRRPCPTPSTSLHRVDSHRGSSSRPRWSPRSPPPRVLGATAAPPPDLSESGGIRGACGETPAPVPCLQAAWRARTASILPSTSRAITMVRSPKRSSVGVPLLGLKCTSEEADSLFNDLDNDGSGLIEYHERTSNCASTASTRTAHAAVGPPFKPSAVKARHVVTAAFASRGRSQGSAMRHLSYAPHAQLALPSAKAERSPREPSAKSWTLSLRGAEMPLSASSSGGDAPITGSAKEWAPGYAAGRATSRCWRRRRSESQGGVEG